MAKPVVRYFVSYASKNEKLKSDLLERLETRFNCDDEFDFQVWEDADILVGAKWHDAIQRAIAQCHFGLLFISYDFLSSKYIDKHELPKFLAKEPRAGWCKALPIGLKKIATDGSVNMKGLAERQLFRDTKKRFFSECRGDKKDDFAEQLWQQLRKVTQKNSLPDSYCPSVPDHHAVKKSVSPSVGDSLAIEPALAENIAATQPKSPPLPPATTVTTVPPTDFDVTIQENIRQVLPEEERTILAGFLRKEAEQDGISLPAGDLPELLCAPKQALDQTIAWLTLAAGEHLKGLRSRGRDAIPAFRERMSEVLGWLLLRAVDPAWFAANQTSLRRATGVRVKVCLQRPSCVEVVVARAESRGACYLPAANGAFRVGARTIPMGGEAGFDPPSTLQEVQKAIWQVVIQRPVPKNFGPEALGELQQALAADALVRRRYHLTVSLGDRSAALTDADLDQLQRDLPELRLILISVPGAESALLLDEIRLDRLIHHFFDIVIEEKNTR